MLKLRRIALWTAIIVLPFGFVLLPLVLVDLRRKKEASKPVATPAERDPKTPNDGPSDGPGSSPRTPDGETPPRLAA